MRKEAFFTEKPILAIVMRELKEALQQEDQSEVDEEMLWHLAVHEDSRGGRSEPEGAVSPERDSSGTSSSSYTPSGTSASGDSPPHSFNRAPGPPHPRPKEVFRGYPIGMQYLNDRPSRTVQEGWSPWNQIWAPYNSHPWRTLDDSSPLQFIPDMNNNNSFFTNHEETPLQEDNNNSELSSTVSTLETSWSSSSEDEFMEGPDLFACMPPIGYQCLDEYAIARGGVGFIIDPQVMERVRSWQANLEIYDMIQEVDEIDRKIDDMIQEAEEIARGIHDMIQEVDEINREIDETDQKEEETGQEEDEIDQKVEEIDQKVEEIDQKVEEIDQKVEEIDQEFGEIDEKDQESRGKNKKPKKED